jgi:hypothetical protein
MCTVTWTHADDGYTLFFNRDELRTRPHEHPPKRWNTRGAAVLAPLDDGGGGTWIAVNEHGLTAALLNHYPRESKAPERPRSRGGIPFLAASHRSVADALVWVRATTMTWFNPFHLALVDATGRNALVTWDGARLSVAGQVRPFMTTSSFCPEEVARAREAQFNELAPGAWPAPAALEAFHRSTNPRGGAWSVWMDRADACTRSMIRIDVSAAHVTMRYEAAHPGYARIDADDVTRIATLVRVGVAAGLKSGTSDG